MIHLKNGSFCFFFPSWIHITSTSPLLPARDSFEELLLLLLLLISLCHRRRPASLRRSWSRPRRRYFYFFLEFENCSLLGYYSCSLPRSMSRFVRMHAIAHCCPPSPGPQSTHGVAIADFWRPPHHDGKISPMAGESGGVHAHPFSLYLPLCTKLQWTLQLRGQIHFPYFISTLCVLCVLDIQRHLGGDMCFLDAPDPKKPQYIPKGGWTNKVLTYLQCWKTPLGFKLVLRFRRQQLFLGKV